VDTATPQRKTATQNHLEKKRDLEREKCTGTAAGGRLRQQKTELDEDRCSVDSDALPVTRQKSTLEVNSSQFLQTSEEAHREMR